MNNQQKKADPVGIGLLKEGDDAYCTLIAALSGQAFMNGLLCVPTYIDAEQPKKLQYFPKISQNCEKSRVNPARLIETLSLSINFTNYFNSFCLRNLNHYPDLLRGFFQKLH
jgi:hypothetical protein